MLRSLQNTAFLGPVVGNPASYSENYEFEPTVGIFWIIFFLLCNKNQQNAQFLH
jgi:hypothetical protein